MRVLHAFSIQELGNGVVFKLGACVRAVNRRDAVARRPPSEKTAPPIFLPLRPRRPKPPFYAARRVRARAVMSSYDEVDLEDMEWNAELGAFTFQCPCGDVFQITPAELRAGEEIAHCPSCSLVVTVVYEDDDLKELIPEGF